MTVKELRDILSLIEDEDADMEIFCIYGDDKSKVTNCYIWTGFEINREINLPFITKPVLMLEY